MQLHVIPVNRYQIAAKLGWGASSTVWLAKVLPFPLINNLSSQMNFEL